MTVELRTMEELENLPEYSIASLYVDTNDYFQVIKSVIMHITEKRNMGGVYVTSTRPAKTIMNRLKGENVNFADIFFVDCVSYTVGGGSERHANVVDVQSPAMLETILLKIQWLMTKVNSDQKFVFVDSINTLSIYNDEKILTEFIHLLINKLRSQDIFTIILSVGTKIPKEVEEALTLASDDTIDLRENKG